MLANHCPVAGAAQPQIGTLPRVACVTSRRRTVASASASPATALGSSPETSLQVIKAVGAKPGSKPAVEVLQSLVQLEKGKHQPEAWEACIADPSARWRLVYTVPSKDVTAASKKGGAPKGKGQYFPLPACQKFDAVKKTFENGVFLGPLGHLTFKGPYTMTGRNLYFDVCTMSIGLGPLKLSFPIKKDCKPLEERDMKGVKKLPFFVYAWADDECIVARGRSGGLALWVRADTDWQAKAGVLPVYK